MNMRLAKYLATFGLGVILVANGFAGGPPVKPKAAVKAAVVMCPVTGEKVKNPAKARMSVYKGKTYYFCCAMCKPKFDRNPAKYIKPKAK
jgi:YHS domain-containing protein